MKLLDNLFKLAGLGTNPSGDTASQDAVMQNRHNTPVAEANGQNPTIIHENPDHPADIIKLSAAQVQNSSPNKKATAQKPVALQQQVVKAAA